jgi:N utilization substance protein A
MKGSRVQSIIKELRGEKIDIIEWSDEPSVFAANALSPAKVSQVRITDINNRKMEVVVTEDQLSLAIGKRGQNVRLATRLVGWDIDIVSEELLKKEIALAMGKMIASGEAVPVTVLEGVSNSQADDLREKGINDVETLATTSVDDLVEILDISLDEAEKIIASAKEIIEARNDQVETTKTEQPSDADSLQGESEITTNAQKNEDEQEVALEEMNEATSESQNAEESSNGLEASESIEEAADEATKDSAKDNE